MASTTLAEWTGRDVRAGEVLRRLDELRCRGERSLATRTSVVTLVAVAPSAVDAVDALRTVHRFGAHHPGRNVVVVPDAEGPGRLDARLSLTAVGAGGGNRPVWFEDVVLHVRGPAAGHLDSLVEPLVLADLPTVVWSTSGRAVDVGSLGAIADAVLVDAREAGSVDGVRELARDVPVIDLSWIRLSPWRQLLARAADAPGSAAVLAAIESVRVGGRAGPRALLAGWVTSRLPGAPRPVLVETEKASVTLDGPNGDGLAVTRDEGAVRASATIGGRVVHEERARLPDEDPTWALGQALGALRRDALYEAAVSGADCL